MKFLKRYILPLFFLAGILITVFYSSCEKDPCTDQHCQHGGSCGNGICTCPVGYDGAQCENWTQGRFIGVYAGFTTCNNGAAIIDTAFVLPDFGGNLNVKFVLHSDPLDTLHGHVGLNQAVWTIFLPATNDSLYQKSYNVTLQSNTRLSMFRYEYIQTPHYDSSTNTIRVDSVFNQCAFLGNKPHATN